MAASNKDFVGKKEERKEPKTEAIYDDKRHESSKDVTITSIGSSTRLHYRAAKFPFHCFKCGIRGHKAADCPTRNTPRRQKQENREYNSETVKTDCERVPELWKEIFDFIKRDDTLSTNNVLLVGLPGVGKSSFINTMIQVISKRRIPKAEVGAGDTLTKTNSLTWFPCMGVTMGDIQEFDQTHDAIRRLVASKSLPNLVDCPGLMTQNQNTDELTELLEILINGQVPRNTKLTDLESKQRKDGTGVLRKELPKHSSDRIHTIVFVHSCINNVPKGLISSLMTAMEHKEGGHGIRIFVVITKQDLLDDEMRKQDYKTNKESLAKAFNLSGVESETIFEMSNYCDTLGFDDPWTERNVLRLLKMIVMPRSCESDDRGQHRANGFADFQLFTRVKLRLLRGNLIRNGVIIIFVFIIVIFTIWMFLTRSPY